MLRDMNDFMRIRDEIIEATKNNDTERLMSLNALIKRELLSNKIDARTFNNAQKEYAWAITGGRCAICGEDLTILPHGTNAVHYDHIIPFSNGGLSTVSNIQVTCRACNLAKSNH